MRRLSFGFALGIVSLFIVPSVFATVLHTDAQAAMTSGLEYAVSHLPLGAIVNASVNFDVSAGPPSPFPAENPDITSVVGTFTWNDGTRRVFSAGSARISRQASDGGFDLDFEGTGPTIDGLTAVFFTIRYNLGVNPFTTTQQLSKLLIGSTIERLRVCVYNNNNGWIQCGDLMGDVSGSVSIVPEPATMVLLGLGGLFIRKYR